MASKAEANSKGTKRKQRYLPHNKPVKKKGAYPLTPGVQGFFITCDGGREHQAAQEALSVIDSYFEDLLERKDATGNENELAPVKVSNKKITFTYSDSSDSEGDAHDDEDGSKDANGEDDKNLEKAADPTAGISDRKEVTQHEDTVLENEHAEQPNGDKSEKIEQVEQPNGDNSEKIEQVEQPNGDNSEKIEQVEQPNGDNSEKIEQVEQPNGDKSEKIELPISDKLEKIEPSEQPNGDKSETIEEPPAKKQCGGDSGNLGVGNTKKSVDKLIEEELRELADKSKRQFLKLESGCNGVVIIKMKKQDGHPGPNEIVQHIMESAASTRKHVARYLLRILPIEVSCYSSEEEISRAIKPIITKYFPEESKTAVKYAVLYDARANSGIDRMKIIDAVAKTVPKPHKVDLKDPEKTIVVQIVKTVCLIGVVEKYKELAKFNIRQLTSPQQ